MGGLATVVAAAILALAFMQVFSIYYSTSITASNTLVGSLQQQSNMELTRLNEQINVRTFNVINPNGFTVPVSNTGQISIAAKDFVKMDVILVFVASANSSKVVIRLPYNTSGTSPNGWRVTGVTTNTGNPEILNPINLPTATAGMWDPTEIIRITIWLSATNNYLKNQGIAISVTTPDGVSSTGTY